MNNLIRNIIIYGILQLILIGIFVYAVDAVDATAVSVTIYGANKTNAQANINCYGCNNTIQIQAWNTSYVKNITIESRNGSGGDVVTFNISNVTGYQVQEMKANGTAVNGYQAGANGMLNFTYTVVGNKTLTLSPAVNVGGYNSTWGWFWNLTIYNRVGILTQNPQKTLSIGTGDDPVQTTQGVYLTSNTKDVGIVIRDSTVDVEGFIGAFDSGFTEDEFVVATRSGHDLVFGTTNAERARIDSGGNFGIGTSLPTTKLDVNGIIRGNGSGLSGLNTSNLTWAGRENRTAAYTRDTVYQNTGSTMWLTIITANAGGVRQYLQSSSDNPPSGNSLIYGGYEESGSAANNTLMGRIYANQYWILATESWGASTQITNVWVES